MEQMSQISMTNKVKKHADFYYLLKDTAVQFDSFGIEYVPQEVLSKIKDKYITRSICRIQSDDPIMCELYCIAFIEYMIAGKTSLYYSSLFSLNDYQKNDKIIHNTSKTNAKKENVSLGFKLNRIDEARYYLLEEIKHKDLMIEKHKKVCRALSYFQHSLICQWLCFNFCTCSCRHYEFCSRIKNLENIATIKKYKSVIKKKRKNMIKKNY